VESADVGVEFVFDAHAFGVAGVQDSWRGVVRSLLMSRVGSSRPMLRTAIWRTLVSTPLSLIMSSCNCGHRYRPGRAMVTAFHRPAGSAASRAISAPRWRTVSQPIPRAVSWLSTGSRNTSSPGVVAGSGMPVVGEGEDLAGLLGLGAVGVGVDHFGAGVVLDEEGQHRLTGSREPPRLVHTSSEGVRR
jgi:hypothetical protein